MKDRIAKGFDILTPFYDGLARLIIGKDIVSSQFHFIESFKECNRVLILGGGSGWILEALRKECPGLQIDFIDLSSNMLNAAKKKSINDNRINFIQGTEEDIPNGSYDGVITNFYLDMFEGKRLQAVIEKIKESLTNSALWIVTDFVNNRRWHGIMLWLMYRFFRIVTCIEATRLPDWQNEMNRTGFQLLSMKKFKHGFISSNLYRSASFSKHKSSYKLEYL